MSLRCSQQVRVKATGQIGYITWLTRSDSGRVGIVSVRMSGQSSLFQADELEIVRESVVPLASRGKLPDAPGIMRPTRMD